ncbi:hypothetical protein A2Z00_01100 [Candidatus Gottesmanbacteria bacterium RBG_13_45_10]|uniref:Uncharacterized protein n=1 Tax=Candidatus Gottesmanbacteria bacterium RBG_13_45_10 TaxID=1798370 RepID=A0A1F5ZGK9_9BACT|nr:MAG: hypothetical protein A2Z00_01100 [Candidatus Gottesmanbacteria bacterium RBG_13_45_10]
MQNRPRNIWWLIISISGLSAIGWIIHTFPPEGPILGVFFLFLFAVSYFASLFLFNIVRRSLTISLGVMLFFMLRYLQLHNPLYIILLIACLFSLELYFQKR